MTVAEKDWDSAGRSVPAVVKTGPGAAAVEFAQRQIGEPQPGEVLLEVLAAGVCGTDLHIVDDEYASAPPVTMGHEVAGRVIDTGDGVPTSWMGRRVAIETYYSACERCDSCRAGRRNLCVDRQSIGSMVDGGFATHMLVPALNLHEVPDNVSDRAAALCEPLACVCRCLLDPPLINAGDRVLVVGPGAMGLLAAQVALAQGAEVTVAGLPKDADRLTVAEGFGAATTTERPEQRSFDVVVECSGSAGGSATCLAAARPAGRYIAIGIFGRPVTVDLDAVLLKELTITSGFASTPDAWRRAIGLLAQGRVDLEPIVGRIARLEEFREVFDELRTGAGLKTLFVPNQRDEAQ
jgi:L-iditol 2-dehydrogenase